MRAPPAILILAAGASSRMRGEDKLLLEIDGTPLILRAVRAACATVPEVIVALPAGDRSRRAWLSDTPARVIEVDDRAMSASIRAGVAVCDADALLIHLADMPEIGANAFGTLVGAWQAGVTPALRACSEDGQPGQPVIFDRGLFQDLSKLTGDVGAKALLSEIAVQSVPLPGRAALIDLDTPEAWANWRAARDDSQ